MSLAPARRLHDRFACDLLEVALSQFPDLHCIGEFEGEDGIEIEHEVDPDHTWAEIAVEVHRRWRGRNRRLIDEPPKLEDQWEQDLQRKAEERRQRDEPKPQKLWPPPKARPMRRKSR